MSEFNLDAFGCALKDNYLSQKSVSYIIERDDGYIECRPADIYFSKEEEWPVMEKTVLNYSQHKILDVGCGAGRHSLYLQEKGHDITGIDISEGAIFVCKKRGVNKVIKTSILNLKQEIALEEKFQSVLLLGNNFGIGGSILGTKSVLKLIDDITTPDANIITSFRCPEGTKNKIHIEYHNRNIELFKAIGQLLIRIRYLKYKSAWFELYCPTSPEFNDIIKNSNWIVEKELIDKSLHYVVLKKRKK